jgi:hypothetical protein
MRMMMLKLKSLQWNESGTTAKRMIQVHTNPGIGMESLLSKVKVTKWTTALRILMWSPVGDNSVHLAPV